MTTSQQEHLDGGYWPLLTGAFIAFVVAVIVVDEARSIPAGQDDFTCGMGCGGGMLEAAGILLVLAGALFVAGRIAVWRGESQ